MDLEYEATPYFCSFYKNIGHNVDKCRNVKPNEGVNFDRNGKTGRKEGKEPLKEFVKTKGNRMKSSKKLVVIDLNACTSKERLRLRWETSLGLLL